MIYFIADTHFSESNILQYENRPFADVSQMDEEMIRRWNSVVEEEDAVYVLGDFGGAGYEAELLGRLKGKKYLVKGNHDVASNEYYRRVGFAEVYDCPIILESFWILSHEPLYVNTNMPYANIFGHVHASPIFRDYSPQHCCVSVERTAYTPVSFQEIAAKVRNGVMNSG